MQFLCGDFFESTPIVRDAGPQKTVCLCPWCRRLPSPYWLYFHHALVPMERLHGVHFSEQIGLLAKVRGVCTICFVLLNLLENVLDFVFICYSKHRIFKK